MTCAACVSHVTHAISSVPGVEAAEVSLATNSANIQFGAASLPIEAITAAVREHGAPQYVDIAAEMDSKSASAEEGGEDMLYEEALRIVRESGKASASYLQRRLQIGYNRAARIIEEMEERGVIGPANGSKAREVID